MKIRRPFTLLEVVIGIALASILIAVLFSTFQRTSLSNLKIKSIQRTVHERMCLQLRLTSIFDKLEFERKKIQFYTASHAAAYDQALYFSYKQEVDSDPSYIGVLNAALFLKQPEKKLCLETYSTTGIVRTELFFEDLKTVSFQFLNAQKGTWESSWPKEADFSPALIKVIVTQKEKKDPFDFGFALNKHSSEIVYYKEKK